MAIAAAVAFAAGFLSTLHAAEPGGIGVQIRIAQLLH
jgi:hypothetical protein